MSQLRLFFFFPQDAFVPSAALSEVHPRLLVLSLKWLQSDSPCVWMHVLFFGLVSEWYLLPVGPEEAFSQLKLAAEKS